MNNFLGQPFSDAVHSFFARRPKDVDGIANTSIIYNREFLLKKLFARFKFGGIPDFWDFDYILKTLFIEGHFSICDTAMGVLPLRCGLTGVGVFEQPTRAIFANPVLGNFEKTIDVDCTVVRLQYNYAGVGYLLNRYATLLAMCDSSVAVNLMNTKAAYVFKCTSKAQAATIQKMYDDITQGRPAVFVGDGFDKENVYNMPAKQNFISDDVQLLKRKIVNEFLTEIGINNTNLDKRERLTDDEVNANNDEVIANIMHWYDNISEGLEKSNKMFNTSLSVQIRKYTQDTGEVNDEFTELN